MRGRRRRVNSVKEEKMSAAFRLCPAREYTTNDRTDARTGSVMATALFAARMTKRERIWLKHDVRR